MQPHTMNMYSPTGLNDIIPDNLLSIFDENELEVSIDVFQGNILP